MRKKVFNFLAVLIFGLLSQPVFAGIEADLEFSKDNGKTWGKDFPILEKPCLLLVKINWQVDETRPTKSPLITKVFCTERDFANANCGKQYWGRKAWFHRPKKYFKGLKDRKPFIYEIDLRARSEGTMGRGNKWSKEKRKFIDTPLPACPAFVPGTYRFYFELGYRVKEKNELISIIKEFDVTINPSEKTAVPATEKKSTPAKKTSAVLPTVTGDYVLTLAELKDLGKASVSKKKSSHELISANGQELAWTLSDIKPGKYYLRQLVQSGYSTGEELLKAKPFIYLNGRPVHFNRATGLTGYKRNFYTIIQSTNAIALKNGDQLRWNSGRGHQKFGDLALTTKKLPVTPIWLPRFYDPTHDDLYRLTGKLSNKLEFSIRNLSGHKQKIKINVTILDYFQNKIASANFDSSTENGSSVSKILSYKSGNSDQYRAIVEVRDNSGYSLKHTFFRFADRVTGLRPKMWLNNGWKWTSIADDKTLNTRTLQPPTSIPGNAKWRGVNLPTNWQDFKRKDHIAWYKKTFSVPAEYLKRKTIIRFLRVAYEADIYLNGKKLYHHPYTSAFGTFECDLSGKLRSGENTLRLAVRDKTALLMPEELSKDKIDYSGAKRGPVGLCPGLDEVYLLNMSEKHIGDVFIKPSFRKKQLSVELSTPKLSGGTVCTSVKFEGKEVLKFNDQPADGKRTTVSKAWNNPICWGPDKFPLLQFVAEVKDENGKIIDSKNVRFGFREVWADGMQLKWNGKIVTFGSRPFLSSWGWALTKRNRRDENRRMIQLAKSMGSKMLRHIYNPGSYAEIADEEGMLIAEGVFSLSHHAHQQLNSNEFWENVYQNAKAVVLSMRNHPSIFTWYLSNEYYGESEKRNGERLRAYGEKILKVDSTRFIEFGCDIDLHGFTKLISTHYPVDMRAFREPQTFLPEAAYWRNFNQKFYPGMKVPAGQIKKCANVFADSPITWGYKPIIINECCWISFFNHPDGLTRIAGDWVYASPWAIDEAHKLANRWFSYGYRDAGASAITLWHWITSDSNHDTLPDIDIDILERYRHFYGGTEVDFNLNLIHAKFKNQKLHFTAELKQRARTLQKYGNDFDFNYSSLKRLPLTIKIPEVKQKTPLKLELTLSDSKQVVYRRTIDLTAYPFEMKKLNVPKRTGILSGKKSLLALLKGATVVKNSNGLAGIDKLVIGSDVKLQELSKFSDSIPAFVKRGGQVILLARTDLPDWLPGNQSLTGRQPAIGYTFCDNDSLLAGIDKNELSFWYPNHRIAATCLGKPKSGNFRSIVDAGGPDGLVYSALTQLFKGKGSYIVCQLVLDPAKNPIAATLWNNLLNTPQEKMVPAAFIGSSSSNLAKVMTQFGIRSNKFDPAKASAGVPVIIDADSKLDSRTIGILQKIVSEGGKVLIHNVTPDNIATVSALTETNLSANEIPAVSWQGRAVVTRKNAVSSGLTNYDLFWKKRPETQDYRRIFFSKRDIVEPLGKYEITGKGFVSLLYPALLGEIKRGKGCFVIDNIQWTSENKKITNHARRIASILMTNIGVEVATQKNIKLPKKLSYTPLDISSVLNRPLVDEKDYDGKGGWTDQGPTADMRNFTYPKGVYKFNKVPFFINRPNTVLVLASKYRKGMPESVTIPINRKADVLFFLQSCAWTSSKHHASYIVNFADGTHYEIKLIGGINLRDWGAGQPDAPFAKEIDTITERSVTIKHQKFGKASFYQMGWINPEPSKTIKSITFKSNKIAVPILAAITIGIKTDSGRKKAVLTAKQLAAVRKYCSSANKLVSNHNLPKAEKLLLKATEIAPGYTSAWMKLAYVLEGRKKYNKAISAYETALDTKPEELEPYLRIGKCYEAMKNYEAAAETYRKSLKVDINQPDIMAALDNVKKLMEK